MKNPVHFCALGGGAGLIPFMPGTFGSLVAIPLALLTALYGDSVYIAITILVSVVGVYLCGKTADDMGVHDHGSIVWDEVAGIFLTFLFVPLSVVSVGLGFVLFRFFDILKPWPIGVVDKTLHGGTGIMLDDILAGVMACVSLHVLLWALAAF